MTRNKLQTCFPALRTREELLAQIHSRDDLLAVYRSWRPEDQMEFLDFCTGARGVRMLYDPFFKKIMDPDRTPERLERLLSLLLNQQVTILAVLPLESPCVAEEGSLLTMDIVVELEDDSILDLEIQKIGYRFPGQRAACYSSDLLLRQYNRICGAHRKKSNYKDIQGVLTIVLFESSPSPFHRFPDCYLHHFAQRADTGLPLDLLQEYLFIPLDIFRKKQHNSDITNELDAWLVFLSMDDPEMILRLITAYPEFKPLYEQVYKICRNVEDAMGLFSEELRILDENTVQLMVDEMQETIDRQRTDLDARARELHTYKDELNVCKDNLNARDARIAELEQLLSKLQS